MFTRFQRVFTACCCVFKVITLLWSNLRNYFENAKACSKRTLKTRVATRLYGLQVKILPFMVRDSKKLGNTDLHQRFPTYFCLRTPKQKKIKLAYPQLSASGLWEGILSHCQWKTSFKSKLNLKSGIPVEIFHVPKVENRWSRLCKPSKVRYVH